jgi:outer membrane autotransporter protein
MSSGDLYPYKKRNIMDGISSGFWGELMVGTATQDARDGYDGYDVKNTGVVFGVDTPIFDEYAAVGAAFAYQALNVDGNDGASGQDSDIDAYTGSLYYTQKLLGGFDFQTIGSFGMSKYDSTRKFSDDSVATADYDGYNYGISANLYKNFQINDYVRITPNVGAKYSYVNIDGYTEKGSALGSTVASSDYESFSSVVGAEVGFKAGSFGQGWTNELKIHGYWDHDFINDPYNVSSKFIQGSTSFESTGMTPSENTYNIGTALSMYSEDNLEVTLGYDAEIKEGYLGQTGMVRIRRDF